MPLIGRGHPEPRPTGDVQSRCRIGLPVEPPRLVEDGYDICAAYELLGHRDVSTTMVYTHVLNRGPGAVRSPLDGLVGGATRRLPEGPPLLPRYTAGSRSPTRQGSTSGSGPKSTDE